MKMPYRVAELRSELSGRPLSAKLINSQTRKHLVIVPRAVASMFALSFVAGCATGQRHVAPQPFSGPGAVPLKMQQPALSSASSTPWVAPENLWPTPQRVAPNEAASSQKVERSQDVEATPLKPEAPPAPLVVQQRVITGPPPAYGSVHNADMTPRPEVHFVAPPPSASPETLPNSSAGNGQLQAPSTPQ